MLLGDIEHGEPNQGVPIAIFCVPIFRFSRDPVRRPALGCPACNAQVVDRGRQRDDLGAQLVDPAPERGLVVCVTLFGRIEYRLQFLTHAETLGPASELLQPSLRWPPVPTDDVHGFQQNNLGHQESELPIVNARVEIRPLV